jgi:anti-sigma B factor antagonist
MSNEPLTLEACAGQAQGCRILRLNGPLTLQGVFAFQTALRADPPQSLVLDLSSVPYMDSAGMGAIINYYVSCPRNGRKLVVAGVNQRVFELFRMTKVDALLTLAATVAEAEQALA